MLNLWRLMARRRRPATYSQRSTLIGSTRAARREGIQAATIALARRIVAAIVYVAMSCEVRPNSISR